VEDTVALLAARAPGLRKAVRDAAGAGHAYVVLDGTRVVLSPTERSIPLYERAGFGPADALMLRTPPQAPTDSVSSA